MSRTTSEPASALCPPRRNLRSRGKVRFLECDYTLYFSLLSLGVINVPHTEGKSTMAKSLHHSLRLASSSRPWGVFHHRQLHHFRDERRLKHPGNRFLRPVPAPLLPQTCPSTAIGVVPLAGVGDRYGVSSSFFSFP